MPHGRPGGDDGPAGTRRFVYDPDGRVLGEYGASADDVKAEFVWALPRVGGGDGPYGGADGVGGYAPLAVASPDGAGAIQLSWVHGNHLGVPLVTTDSAGNPAATAGDYLLPGFPGQSQVFADFYYNRYRDYDSATGRYIQADPIGLEGGSNPYLYANGNPINVTDPDGRVPVLLPVIAVGIVTGALISLDLQLIEGRSITCIDWRIVARDGAIGGATAGIGAVAAPFIGRGVPWIKKALQRGGSKRPIAGDLTRDEIKAIQEVVDKPGRPLDVVGCCERESTQRR